MKQAVRMRSRAGIVALSVSLGLSVARGATPARGDEHAVRVVVLKEHGAGSPTLAQPYLDRFMVRAAQQNDWSDAKGQYFTSRPMAERYIAEQGPHYGILSLGAFVALREKYGLDVIGRVSVKLVGGRRYEVVAKGGATLADCKGKKLATDHADDPRFVERVAAGGALALTDFELVRTQRPLQTIKKVLEGEAACALIDDAQAADLPHIEGAGDLRSVWKGPELPPMVLAAFPAAPAAERARFQQNFGRLCSDDAAPVCAEVGITALEVAAPADYAAVVKAYGN